MSIFPTRILLATDGSKEAQLAASAAIELANKTGSELHVVHARLMLPWTGYSDTTNPPVRVVDEEEARESVMRWLDEQVERIEAKGGNVMQAHLRLGRPDEGIITVAEEIVSLAEEIGAGLVVMGSRGLGGIRRALMGSVSDSVVRHAHCAVLVVRTEDLRELPRHCEGRSEEEFEEMISFPTKILVATDASEEATLASRTAAEIADKTGSEVHVVHVRARIVPHFPGYYIGPEVIEHAQQKEQEYLDRKARRLLDTQAEEIRAVGGRMAQAHLKVGKPDEEIVALAEELGAKLIVIGSRGQGGIRRSLMGSVSDSVARHAHCAVLVVRREE